MGGDCSKVTPVTDAAEGKLSVDARAKVIAEVSGQYESTIAALKSEVAELRSSNQPAPAVAESVSLSDSAQARSSATKSKRPDLLDHAVAAGVVAVGSRIGNTNYVEEMEGWSHDALKLLPKAVLLQVNMAAVQAIGPAYLQVILEQQQIDELTKAVEALAEEADLGTRTKAEYQLAEAVKRKEKADAKLAKAVAHINAIKLASAETISPGLASDGEKYTEAISKLVAEEKGVLDEVNAEAAAMVNVGALKEGDEVEVVTGGAMQRAKVRRVVDQAVGTYELSLWAKVKKTSRQYEAGFDTSRPELVTLRRLEIYANTKHTQALSKEARALAEGRAAAVAKGNGGAAAEAPTSPNDAAFLALVYSDAERTVPLLHDLGARINAQMPAVKSIVAPLKAETRAAIKTLDKYGGDYSRLTDLARM